MINEKNRRSKKNIRSIVVKDGEYLKLIDYFDYFKEDFSKIVDLFKKPSKFSTNKDFNEYLELQAKALGTAHPILDVYEHKKWAELKDTPLELTLFRENYEDKLNGIFKENEELKKLLKENNINLVPKDCLGVRIGNFNKQGKDNLISIKKYIPLFAKNMPYNNEYEKNISEDKNKENNQTMVQ